MNQTIQTLPLTYFMTNLRFFTTYVSQKPELKYLLPGDQNGYQRVLNYAVKKGVHFYGNIAYLQQRQTNPYLKVILQDIKESLT